MTTPKEVECYLERNEVHTKILLSARGHTPGWSKPFATKDFKRQRPYLCEYRITLTIIRLFRSSQRIHTELSEHGRDCPAAWWRWSVDELNLSSSISELADYSELALDSGSEQFESGCPQMSPEIMP